MKNRSEKALATVLFLIFAFTASFAQEANTAKLEFVKQSEDLGVITVESMEPRKLDIEFTNTGTAPLVVSSARGCCGTRITDYTKEPILPGEKGKVSIEFRLAPRAHNVSRTVSIMSNDPSGMKVFHIKGEVVETAEAPFGAAPARTGAPRVN